MSHRRCERKAYESANNVNFSDSGKFYVIFCSVTILRVRLTCIAPLLVLNEPLKR